MTTHAGPHVHVEGECSWSFDGDGCHLWCSELCVVGSDECDGTDHPHHGPRRIQLRRTKGWRKPSGAVVVSRPSKWGNPFVVHEHSDACGEYLETCAVWAHADANRQPASSRRDAVTKFRHMFQFPLSADPDYSDEDEIRAELRGRDLACWCPLDQPCHADVLLEIANAPLDVSPPVARVESLQRRCFDECETAGWDPGKVNSFAEECAHLHEEVSEAFREWRLHKDFEVRYEPSGKPTGIPIELADVLIGLFYNAELHGFDLLEAFEIKHAWNLRRSYQGEGRTLHPAAGEPVARVEDAGSRPLAATVGDEGAVSRVRVGSRVRRRSEGRSGLPGQVDEP